MMIVVLMRRKSGTIYWSLRRETELQIVYKSSRQEINFSSFSRSLSEWKWFSLGSKLNYVEENVIFSHILFRFVYCSFEILMLMVDHFLQSYKAMNSMTIGWSTWWMVKFMIVSLCSLNKFISSRAEWQISRQTTVPIFLRI